MLAFAVGAILALASYGVGAGAGFHALSGYLSGALLGGSVAVAAERLVRHYFPGEPLAGSILRFATLAFAIVVAVELLLGSLGLLYAAAQIAAFAAVAVATLTICRQTIRRPGPFGPGIRPRYTRIPPATLIAEAALVPMLALIIVVGIDRSPLTLYDSLSYHLVFPARWLLDHRLSIVPTPFSDEAQAYAPANGELFFLWLMTPFHGDLLARIGQVPFYLLGAVALYGIARQAGAPPAHAVYPALLYAFARPIVEQALGADVDLICWSLFLTSIYLATVAAARNERRDWAMLGISLGVYAGTKFVALVFLPILIAFAVRRGIRRQMIWTMWGLVILAAPWYLRNWIVAGSPIYPSSLTLARWTVARGAFTRQAMQHSVFHTTDVRLFPVMVAHAMGTDLLVIWLPAALIGGWAMVTSRRKLAIALAASPVVMAALYWFAVPDNVDSRFLLPAAVLALLPFAFIFRRDHRWNRGAHAFLAASLVWLAVGYRGAIPTALPWYMSGWLSLDGIVARDGLVWLALLEAAALAIALALRRAPTRAAAALAVLCAGAASLGVTGNRWWCATGTCELLAPTSIYLRSDVVRGWEWVHDHVSGETIANTGNNVPYPLFGDHLVNRVFYVNIDRHRDWRFHDYEHAHRRDRNDELSDADRLATPSGVLVPLLNASAPHIDAVRPRYPRWNGLADAWMSNLRARGVTILFVSALSAYEVDYNRHDAEGFPVEAEWARDNPAVFNLLYENSQVRVFAVRTR